MFITIKLNKIFLLLIIIILVIGLFLYLNFDHFKHIPSYNDMEFRVTVDAGHGSIDTGTHYNNIYEKDINLSIAKYLENSLKENNIIPIMTRTEDKLYQDSRREDLYHRPEVADKYNTNLFISIHVNNFPSSVPSGSQIFFKKNSEESKKLAEYIQNELIKLRPENNRSISPGDYYVLNKAPCTAVLIEAGFISNSIDRKYLQNKKYQQSMADSIKNGIISYFRDQMSGLKGKNQNTDNNNKHTSSLQVYYLSRQQNLITRNFSYPTGAYLNNDISKSNNQEILAFSILQQLLEPPTDLLSPLPETTKIKSVEFKNHKITVDFSIELQQDFTGGAGVEQAAVNSIVASLFSIPGIKEVNILIDGKEHQSIGGHIILGKYKK